MRRRVETYWARALPHGPVDGLRQILLFALGYYTYRIVRGAGDESGAATAFENGRKVINLERSLHVFAEPSIQAWTNGSHLYMGFATFMYLNAQFTITMGALAYIYIVHNARFYFVRNMFTVGMSIAMTCFVLFPVAPPRFFPEWGFFDTVQDFTHVSHNDHKIDALFNPYAAVPSMHVCFALMIAIPLAKMVRFRAAKAFWCAYPLVVAFVIVSTGNHYFTDAFLGACTAGVAAVAATALGKARPRAWRFTPAPAMTTARVD